MDRDNFNDGLLGFLDASPTPFHAVENMAGMFKNAGFEELKENQKWKLQEGKKYFVTRNSSSIIAFTYPKHKKEYLMLAAHTDSPNLKLKPNPVIKAHKTLRLGVENYGGILLSTWFDRELSLAGRINYTDSNNNIKETLIDVRKPIAIIPSLAIHLDTNANKDKTINKQTDITPIISTDDDFEFDEFLKWQLSNNKITDVKNILASELSFYDTKKSSFLGLRDDFISSARLDNLLSCYVGMLSICSIEDDTPMLFIANDHEEIGSQTSAGAESLFLQDTLKRVFNSHEEYVIMLQNSFLISIDNAHALHPNFASKHDENHTPYINKGVVVKVNANQRYTSNSTTISKFVNAASKAGKDLQYFVTRNDMGCGSTIGPIIASKLGIATIDVGVPTWGMHSIREVCGRDDAYSLYKIILNFGN